MCSGAGGSCDLIREFTLKTGLPATADPASGQPALGRPIPIAQLHLDRLIGWGGGGTQPTTQPTSPITSGYFRFLGALRYRARDGNRRHIFSVEDAELIGLELAEFSPLRGQVNLNARRIEVEQTESPGHGPQWSLTRLQFSGSLVEFDLARAMRLAGQRPCSGTLNLQVDYADIEPGRPLGECRLAGDARGLDLVEWSALLNDRFKGGQVHGPAQLAKVKLAVKDGKLDSGSAELVGPDGPAGAQAVDLKLIMALMPAASGLERFDPPEQIPYRGLRIAASTGTDGGLILQGLGGDDHKSLMTVLLPTPKWLGGLGLPNFAFHVHPSGAMKSLNIAGVLEFIARPIPPATLSDVQRAAGLRDR
jgi:hypothetical protein